MDNQASNLFFVQLAEIVLTSHNPRNKGKGHCTGNKTDYLCPPLSSTGRGLVRLRRLVWDQTPPLQQRLDNLLVASVKARFLPQSLPHAAALFFTPTPSRRLWTLLRFVLLQ